MIKILILILASFIALSPVRRGELVSVYVNGTYVGLGTVDSGITRVPVRAVAEALGASVGIKGDRVDINAQVVKSTDAPIKFDEMQNTWRAIRKSGARIRIKDPVVKKAAESYQSDSLEFDFELLDGLLSRTGPGAVKPHDVELFVILYDTYDRLIYRGNVRIRGMPTDGGRSVMTITPYPAVNLSSVTAIDAEFVAAWYTRDK